MKEFGRATGIPTQKNGIEARGFMQLAYGSIWGDTWESNPELKIHILPCCRYTSAAIMKITIDITTIYCIQAIKPLEVITADSNLWWRRVDSDHRPMPYEDTALTSVLPRQIIK